MQNTFKRLSESPRINMHYYMPEGRPPRDTQALEKAEEALEKAAEEENSQARELVQSQMSVHMLDNESTHLVQMMGKVKELQRNRSRNKVKQGSRKILLEMGHAANCLYGREETSRLVDQLLVVMVRGDVAPEHLGRKFVDLKSVMKYHDCEHETKGMLQHTGVDSAISVKLLRFQQGQTADEAVQEFMEEKGFEYKHLFPKNNTHRQR